MNNLLKLLIGLGLAAALAGCVVVPAGPPHAYVGVGVAAPPVVVVRPYGYYDRYYYHR